MDLLNDAKFNNRYEIKCGQIYSVSHCKPLHIYNNSLQGPFCSLWDPSKKKITRIYLKKLFPKQFK